MEIGKLIAKGKNTSEELFRKRLLSHQQLLFKSDLSKNVSKVNLVAWPYYLYIPSNADWKNYWFLPPPTDHLYAMDWASSSVNAYSSKEEGKLYSFSQIQMNENISNTDADLGILYNPINTYSVVSVQPTVNCSGCNYILVNIDFPTAGYVRIISSLFVAAWQMIPGTNP